MSAPERLGTDYTWVEDFAVTCGAKHADGCCDRPASWFVEVHRPGKCLHPAFNASGNRELFVCLYHLGQLERLAEKELRQPWWVRWFRQDWDRCRTCNTRLQTPADILQVVLALGERGAA